MQRFRGPGLPHIGVGLSDYHFHSFLDAEKKKHLEAFVVRRSQELRRARRISLLMFFVDIPMASDFVHPEMLSVVLALLSVPETRLTIAGEVDEGMRARGRTDDGEGFEWLDVTAGLWQGCVLSPFFFKYFKPRRHIQLHRVRRHFEGLGAPRGGRRGKVNHWHMYGGQSVYAVRR